MIASLKNEGLILAIIILVFLGVTQLLNNGNTTFYNRRIRFSALATVALAPALAWRLLLHFRNIANDLSSPTRGPFCDGRVVSRPDDASEY